VGPVDQGKCTRHGIFVTACEEILGLEDSGPRVNSAVTILNR